MRKLPAPTTTKLAFAARLVLAASLALLFIAGCSRRQPDPVIRLTWWIPYAEDSAEYPTFQALADAYTERTGTVIDLVSVPWDDIAPRGAASRLSLALEAGQDSSGRSPDLWGPVPSTWIGPYAAKGQALALEAGQIQNSGQYADVAMSASRWAGQQYALPVLMDSIALIYNREWVSGPPGKLGGTRRDIPRAHQRRKRSMGIGPAPPEPISRLSLYGRLWRIHFQVRDICPGRPAVRHQRHRAEQRRLCAGHRIPIEPVPWSQARDALARRRWLTAPR